MNGIFVLETDGRRPVQTIEPWFLHAAQESTLTVLAEFMECDLQRHPCVWLGCRVGKGVTDVSRGLTIVGTPRERRSGLHSDLVAGFPEVDPYPLCYDAYSQGFGPFIRWIFIATRDGCIGVDWSINMPVTSGVATTMLAVIDLAQTLLRHGTPATCELALLYNGYCERPFMKRWRADAGLKTVGDWAKNPQRFSEHGNECPRCGQPIDSKMARFCVQCGCDLNLVWTKHHKRR